MCRPLYFLFLFLFWVLCADVHDNLCVLHGSDIKCITNLSIVSDYINGKLGVTDNQLGLIILIFCLYYIYYIYYYWYFDLYYYLAYLLYLG